VADYNDRSISLLKKLGFADEGTMRMPGEQVDLLLLASAV
jgi:RimJ/RimL family protein N-acetyltransferase